MAVAKKNNEELQYQLLCVLNILEEKGYKIDFISDTSILSNLDENKPKEIVIQYWLTAKAGGRKNLKLTQTKNGVLSGKYIKRSIINVTELTLDDLSNCLHI